MKEVRKDGVEMKLLSPLQWWRLLGSLAESHECHKLELQGN